MMETRIIEYPRSSGLDYHHNSPLIGEIPTNEYAHFHRSIDQLRSLNERGILNTNHIQNVLVQPSNSPIPISIIHASGGVVYNEIKLSDEKLVNEFQLTTAASSSSNKVVVRRAQQNEQQLEAENIGDEYHQQQSKKELQSFRIIHSPQYTIATSIAATPSVNLQNNNHNFSSVENLIDDEENDKSKIFTSKADLQLHTQAHMREAKPYKCTQCSKSFANSSYLSQHTRIHLGIKPYRCEICQRKFTQLSHLQQHIRTHTGDKPYKCRTPGCVKAFSQLSNLQSHSRSHQTDKPFKCNSCYKCFVDEPALLEHIPKHKESKHLKTHICQYCGKSYTQETYLQKHMQKHSERTDKRPPIGGRSGGGNQAGNNQSQNNSSSNSNNNNNNNSTTNNNNNNHQGNNTTTSAMTTIPSIPPMAPAPPQEHPYWPKVSPDSAANISSDIIQHQQQSHHDFSISSGQIVNNHEMHHHHHHHHQQQQQQRDETIEELRHGGQGLSLPPVSTPNGYDNQTKLTSNSAFTPINSMPTHLNSLQHHQLSQRPYIYDAISFQNKNVAQNTGNGFPNQLISLHQIRNYAHQPGNIPSEHLIGVSIGKEKG